ncbi:MAG: GIY-YIG nuclease family protein [Clostridiales bacterium]|jgi:hypothetical protein|nr:GIY-YIG nuclease family protein [Clostridiales bacterium]
MDKARKKELAEEFSKIKVFLGVAAIKNISSGKTFVTSSPNLKNNWITLKMQLNLGTFANKELQKDWNELGETFFAYEILEQKDASDAVDARWEAKQLEKKWMDNLLPYGDKGYHKHPAK